MVRVSETAASHGYGESTAWAREAFTAASGLPKDRNRPALQKNALRALAKTRPLEALRDLGTIELRTSMVRAASRRTCGRTRPARFFQKPLDRKTSEHGHCGLRRTRQSLSPQAPLLGAPSLTSALKRSPSSGCRSWRGMMPNDRQISRSLSGVSVLRARNSRLPRRSLATNPGLPPAIRQSAADHHQAGIVEQMPQRTPREPCASRQQSRPSRYVPMLVRSQRRRCPRSRRTGRPSIWKHREARSSTLPMHLPPTRASESLNQGFATTSGVVMPKPGAPVALRGSSRCSWGPRGSSRAGRSRNTAAWGTGRSRKTTMRSPRARGSTSGPLA